MAAEQDPAIPDAPFDPFTAAEARVPGHWLSEADQVRFFENALERAHLAGSRSEPIVRRLQLAGTVIELVFAGPALASRFMPALAHLAVAGSGEPDVTFYIWDSASTGVPMIPPPCKHECFTDRGDIWGMASQRIKSAFHWSEFSVNLLDVERRCGIFWVQSPEELPYWTMSSPLRTLLHWWMEQRGAQLLHAAAVGTEAGALLLTGKGGVGKSTTALACLAAGLRYVADDYLVVQLDPVPVVFSLYSTAKLDWQQLERFPELLPCVANERRPNQEKAVLQLLPHFGSQVAHSLQLRAIATPRFSAEPGTSFVATPPILLERAASFTTLSQLPHAGGPLHGFIQRMTARLPGFEMLLGTELDRIPGAITALLQLSPSELRAIGAVDAGSTQASARRLISVIVPVYNGAAFLEEAIGSILAQHYAPLEIIVVDDGSTDNTAEIARRLPVDVRYFRQENAGAASARNRGIKQASGELIAFLDVDDLWPEGQLTVLADRMTRDPQLDLVHGRAQLARYRPGGGLGDYIGNPSESFPWYIGAGLYHRRAFERVGWFDAEMRFGEDSDWFQRATEQRLQIAWLDEVTLFVRRHDGNMTRGKTLLELNTLRILKKTLDRRAGGPRPQADR